MTPATAWRCCAAAGVVAFLCSWGFGRIPGLIACGPDGGLGPIIAFEFVRSPADVAALFGAEPCRSTLIRAQTIGLLLDALGFIPAYTAFLVFAAKAATPAKAGAKSRAVGNWTPAVAGVAVMVILAGLADEIEGLLLHRILSTLPGDGTTIGALWWAVHVKFALLGMGTLAIGIMLWRPEGAVRIVLASVVIAGAGMALSDLYASAPFMMTGFTIAWVAILLAAIAASLRPSIVSAS